MGDRIPKVILRMGSHAEKEYFEKTAKFFDGIIVGANLLESTPAATASFLAKLKIPYYIDPMTYAYGSYIDKNGVQCNDLDWIKSEQKVDKETSKRDFKKSYKTLSPKLGRIFEKSLDRNRAIDENDLKSPTDIKALCETVSSYQTTSIEKIFSQDSEWGTEIAESVKRPQAVFAPYFYLERKAPQISLNIIIELIRVTSELKLGIPVHGIICADQEYLAESEFIDYLVKSLNASGANGIWFWFSRFDEKEADEVKLKNFRTLVEKLSSKKEVYNLHGGYYSLTLSKFGLSGISHGIGYGEQKDVIPVIGQSIPTVRYYIRDLHKTLGVPEIERSFKKLGVSNSVDFQSKICNCAICNGIMKNGLDGFAQFGDRHYSSEESKRLSQTPAAAKRCRFHFLLSRIIERNMMRSVELSDVISNLNQAFEKWKDTPLNYDGSLCENLIKWLNVISK